MGTSTSVIVRWKTDLPTNTKVKYGTSPGNLSQEVFINNSDSIHIANLTGLQPNTKYYYSVGYTCGMMDYVLASGTEYYYYSMPNTTTDPLRFWILGDVCSGDYRQTNVRDAYMNYLGGNRLHGIIFGGDNSKLEGFDGTDIALDYNLFPVYPNQFRNTVSWISLGNHDYGPRPYNDSTIAAYNAFSYPTQGEAGGVASNSKGYYSFDIGDAHFIVLNPYHPDFFISRGVAIPGCGGLSWDCSMALGRKNMFMLKFDDPITQVADFNAFQQVKWLKLDLANTTKKWKIVLFHTPPYTKGGHDSDPQPSDWSKTDEELKVVRELLVPILEQYKVDLIVTSHTHSYARSFLMQGVTGTPTRAAFRANPNQFLQSTSGKYTPTPTAKPYIKNSPYNGAVHVVTGNAGRGTPTSAPDVPASGVPHPVMYYSDSTDALNATGGSVELLIHKNRLDVKYIKLNNDMTTTSYIKDEFTIMKDVNKKTTYNNPTFPLALTASWEGTYSWKIVGGGSLPNTTQGITVSPTANTTYIVNDGYNGGNGFLADTFIVNACPATITLNSTISTNTTYQASQWIKGTNTNIIAPNTTVEYRAGYIELLPTSSGSAAFIAAPANGNYFLALPVGCAGGGGGNSENQPTVAAGLLPSNKVFIKIPKKKSLPKK
ncbi:MAG: metallophosphoesterase family protein [Spirosomataceae bacterium]